MNDKFFLGAVCGGEFRTDFPQIMAEKPMFTYILKGGAGTGKSSLMKRIAGHFEKNGSVERYYCSSDPDSLDAVVISKHNAAVCDGTSPHVFEPVYAGIGQRYIDLGELWDKRLLDNNREEIIFAADRNKSLLASSSSFNRALSVVLSDTMKIGRASLDTAKAEELAEELCGKLFTGKKGNSGRLLTRRITALTEFGSTTMKETFAGFGDLYVLTDDLFAAEDSLLKSIADTAQRLGFTVIVSKDQFIDGAYQHLLIPELSAAFIDGNAAGDVPNAEKLGLTKLYDPNSLTENAERLERSKLISAELAAETSRLLHEAKTVHDQLESFYIKAMDFAAVDKLTEKLIAEIEKM